MRLGSLERAEFDELDFADPVIAPGELDNADDAAFGAGVYASAVVERLAYKYQPPPAATKKPAASTATLSALCDLVEVVAVSAEFESRLKVGSKFGAGALSESVSTASTVSERAARGSAEDGCGFAGSRVSWDETGASNGCVSLSFVSVASLRTSDGSASSVCDPTELAEEFRASGSSHAGIFTSSAAKSKLYAPGAGSSLGLAGISKVFSDSRESTSRDDFEGSVALVAGISIACFSGNNFAES